MAVINRTLDSSQQKYLENMHMNGTVTGESDVVFHAPYPCSLVSAKAVAVGLSGAPTAALNINRFVVGAGDTLIPLAAALTLVAVGTSGPQSFTVTSSALLQAGDRLVVTHAGSNAACRQLNVAAVVQVLQDIRSFNF